LEIRCLRCGTCCAKYQPRLSLAEAHRIADTLGVSWQYFADEYSDKRWPGIRSLLVRQKNGFCAFLKTSPPEEQPLTVDCLIHDFKPACCREWKTGLHRPECQQGLKNQWGVSVDASGALCGARDKIEAFERFINSHKREE
jgi:Fe-S-cluster containining protein